GCTGSAGAPTFTGVDLPRLGQTATAELSNVPPAAPVACSGFTITPFRLPTRRDGRRIPRPSVL
ncbi:MAG: hypothetical protein R3178_09900, partial [Rhodothermales bacterium]|nr:hypothetical protein [Rhodothermales bacterium]